MKYWLAVIGCVVCFTVAFCIRPMVAGGWPANYAYVPAAYDVINGNLVLYPLSGENEIKVRLPKTLGGYAVSPDGKAIFSTAGGAVHNLTGLADLGPGLFRIDLTSMLVSDVPGSGNFRFFSSMSTTRQEETVVAGKYWDGSKVVCGVFSLSNRSGRVRPVLSTGDCSDALSRSDISLSPDLKYAVAIHGRSLELIDMLSGQIRRIGDGFKKAAWSPDGRWIAAAEDSLLRASIVLLDGKTFVSRKTLASSMVLRVLWSPDSRFLLARRSVAGCGPDAFTYEAFEVETGEGTLIESSRCKVWNTNDVGWITRSAAANR